MAQSDCCERGTTSCNASGVIQKLTKESKEEETAVERRGIRRIQARRDAGWYYEEEENNKENHEKDQVADARVG